MFSMERVETVSMTEQPGENVDLPMKLSDKDLEAIVGFWWTSTLLKKLARRFFTRLGSSEAFFNLMVMLHRADEPMTQNQLSQLLLVDKSNVTGLLDRLTKAGLVRRNRVLGDRRSYHVTLTERGGEVIEKLDAQYTAKAALLMANFSEQERDEMIRLTHKLREAMAASGL